MKKLSPFCLLTFYFLLVLSISAQNFSVHDIMAEPSMAGMRPDSQKISPDGKYVIFAWNPEGKEPRNLYIVNTSGYNPEPRILLPANANRPPTGESRPPENKLNYGLEVNDEFARSRAGGGFFGVEFSPDSKRILYPQSGDLYIMDLEKTLAKPPSSNVVKSKWSNYEAQFIRRADLLPNIVNAIKMNGINEQEAFGYVADARNKLLAAINEVAKGQDGDRSAEQKQTILKANEYLGASIKWLIDLQEKYPKLQKNEPFIKLQDELAGTENRISIAQLDYNDALKYSQTDTKPRRIMRTQGTGGARWLDNDKILYQSAGNYFVLDLKETSITQVTRDANPDKFIAVTNASSSKDGKLLAYALSDSSTQRPLFVPNYLGEYVQAPSFRRGWSTQTVYATPTDGSRMRPFEIKLPKAEGVSYIRSIKWAADNQSLIIDRIDKDLKRRQLFYVHNVGSKVEQIITVTEETDEKWVASLSRIVEPNPKNADEILFASERDGFNHLYLATLEHAKPQPNPNGEQRQENPTDAGYTSNVKIEQLTKGNYEIDWAKWTANANQILFSSTEENTAERQIYALVEGRTRKVIVATSGKGMITNPQLDEAVEVHPTLLYEFSKWNAPTELYATQVCPTCAGLMDDVQLTKTTPESFKQIKWNEPKFIDIPTKDNKKVKAKIYLPDNFEQNRAKQTFPMVFFVHGAGYLQNTINGWNNYYREFMFNEMLVKKGYIVLDIDYRGSAGYGRDWRTDVYDFLGGLDMQDHLDAIDFAVKNYAVNPSKIGVYGGSYGGFMAEMLVFRAPEKIAAAAALRPVADWKNYYASSPIYTAERLGFPEKNPEGYKRSSPIFYADKLQKPLLILHGLVDSNVPAQDSMQLIEKLIRLEKTPYFEAMIFPSENHAFERPTSWTDEYSRILTFFEKHLK